jgi:hypothetical protein
MLALPLKHPVSSTTVQYSDGVSNTHIRRVDHHAEIPRESYVEFTTLERTSTGFFAAGLQWRQIWPGVHVIEGELRACRVGFRSAAVAERLRDCLSAHAPSAGDLSEDIQSPRAYADVVSG